MKTKSNILAAAILLTAVTAGFGQPTITNQPQTQAVAPGGTATFQVGATGTGPLAYQWQRNLGAGFSDLADRTNSVLTLTNAQPWDALDYRVVVTNISGARTSAVAHLYVMTAALLTNRVVLDNFDTPSLARWDWAGTGIHFPLLESNQQFTVRGKWPGLVTHAHLDTWVRPELYQNWSVANNQTLECRVDLVGMSENATNAAGVVLWSQSEFHSYILLKGRDFVQVAKWVGGGVAVFFHEQAVLKNTNVVLALALTRVAANVVLTARVLDKDDQTAVLYQRSVVDTPQTDRTFTSAELLTLSGMNLSVFSDSGAALTSGDYVFLNALQYTDGTRPELEVTYDNLELWTYRVPITRYVDANSTNATPPYTNWFTAATNIQDAVDAALAGDEIVVTNGTYGPVSVTEPIALRSVKGPQWTVINGGGTNQCVFLMDNASLTGFTLTNGWAFSGGGLACESTNAMVTNCVLVGNSASHSGGGVYGGTLNYCMLSGNSVHRHPQDTSSAPGGGAAFATLNNCTLTGNSTDESGGGAAWSTLNNCTLTGNSASYRGGGAFVSTLRNCALTGNSTAGYGGGTTGCTLYNCTLSGNSARSSGGAAGDTLYNCTLTGNAATNGAGGAGAGAFGINCTLYNCIVYFNTSPTNANYLQYAYQSEYSGGLNYCCTTPMPTNGVDNITNAPLFVDYAGGNLRLHSNSPCINAGRNAYAPGPTDLDGLPRIVRGTVDIGAYEFQGPGSVISYAWLQQYDLPTDGSADFTDPDADGHTTWQEWRCLTAPTNALSVLRLLSASLAGTNVTVSWRSMAGVNYFLECSTNLSASPPFTLLSLNLPGQPGTTSYTDTNAAFRAVLFYRVGVEQ